MKRRTEGHVSAWPSSFSREIDDYPVLRVRIRRVLRAKHRALQLATLLFSKDRTLSPSLCRFLPGIAECGAFCFTTHRDGAYAFREGPAS